MMQLVLKLDACRVLDQHYGSTARKRLGWAAMFHHVDSGQFLVWVIGPVGNSQLPKVIMVERYIVMTVD